MVHESMRGEFVDGFRQSREVAQRHSGDRERSREKTSRRKREQEKSEDEI